MKLWQHRPDPHLYRYLCSGVVNTLGGYASFVAIAQVLPQWLAAILTDSIFQVIRYQLFRHWVFAQNGYRVGHFPSYLKRSLPISLLGYGNVALLSLWFPAWLTGLINVGIAILAYRVFRHFFRTAALTSASE